MNDQKKSPKPEEIEEMLRQIKPIPSQMFYDTMINQPWNRKARRTFKNWVNQPRLVLAFLTIILIGIVLFFAAPSYTALASRIAQFFTSTSRDMMIIELPLYEDKDQDTHPLTSLSEAAKYSNIEFKLPTSLPEAYQYKGAFYNPIRQSISVDYESKAGSILRITQRVAGIEYQSISVNAKVEKIKIGDVVGEYVKGGFRAVQPQEDSAATTATVQATWDPEAKIHFLRWQDEDILFEILYIYSEQEVQPSLNMKQLIEIAESLE